MENGMRKVWMVIVVLALGVAGAFVISHKRIGAAMDLQQQAAKNYKVNTLILSSPALAADHHLPLQYTCYQANVSPPVQWQGMPAGTKSFVLFMERVAADKSKTAFVNWAVFDIPATAQGLPEKLPDIMKDGTKLARSDYKAATYFGPCDPKGQVDYVLRLFALDATLGLKNGVAKDKLVRAMNGHVLDESDLAFVHYFQK